MILPVPKTIIQNGSMTKKQTKISVKAYSDEYENKALQIMSLFLPQCIYYISENADISIELSDNLDDSGESYILDIKSGVAVIECSGYLSMRNALAAYSKLVSISDSEIIIPDVHIEDNPVCSHRGAMLDLARGIKDFEKLKEDIILLGKMCFNTLHLHLSDGDGLCVYLDSFPKEGCLKNSYTKAQMSELVSFCKILGLEIIPEFDIPAHSTQTLRLFPDFKCVTENPENDGLWTVCAAIEDVYVLYDKVIGELCELFPGRYFHVGGDELTFIGHAYARCEWDNCKNCRELRKKHGLSDMVDEYYYFVNRIYDIVKKYNRRMILWSDVFDCTKPAPYPKDVIMQYWNISVLAKGNNNINKQLAFGYDVINSYFPETYIDIEKYMTPEKIAIWHWLKNPESDKKYSSQVLGSEMCAWEYGNTGAYEFYNRTLAPCSVIFADKLWNGQEISYTDEYAEALTKAVLGAETPSGFELFKKFFGSVIPPRSKEIAYYDKISVTKDDIDTALQILEKITENKQVAAYREALKAINDNL